MRSVRNRGPGRGGVGRAGPGCRLWPVLVGAALLSACAGGGGTLGEVAGRAGSALGDALVATAQQRIGTVQPFEPGRAPATTRPQAQIERLLAKGTVRGDELLAEMLAVRQAVTAERSARSVAQMFGSAPTGGNVDPQDLLKARATEAALSTVLEVARQALLTYSLRELDRHLLAITGDGDALRRETVQMPDPRRLTPQQQQRAVTMGALVVMLRLSNQVLERARKDFVELETEYERLIERREKAAQVLYGVLARGVAGRQELLRNGLTAQDVAFIDSQLARMPLADFAQDVGAQNVALGYLARTDPSAFAAYRAESQGLVGRTRGAVRLAGGVTAFGVVLAVFAEQVAAEARSSQGPDLGPLLPLMAEFGRQALPAMKAAAGAGGAGFRSAGSSGRIFRVLDAAGAGVELSSSRDVYAELRKRRADDTLRQALFRNGASGLLHRLYLCSPAEAGRLLDTALPAAERAGFARSHLALNVSDFSFANSFDGPPEQRPVRERELGDALLRADHRERTAADTRAFAPLQRAVAASGFERWNDDQLLRLIFSNREGLAQHATLELGSTRVRPIATPRAVFAYESLVDQCRGLVAEDAPRPAVVPAATGRAAAPVPPAARAPDSRPLPTPGPATFPPATPPPATPPPPRRSGPAPAAPPPAR
jgi:hypothetical protein